MKTQLLLFLISALFLLSLTKEKHSKAYKNAMKVLNGFCAFVPSGQSLVGDDTLSVQGFYMGKTEVTNIQYQEFLYYLKKSGQTEKLAIARIDSAAWSTPRSTNTQYEKYYHVHPAYKDYPVVNVSKEGAMLYCDWLSFMYDSLSNGELKIKFRLPVKAEYIRAARGDDHYADYPWKGPYLRNAQGMYLCNFLKISERNVTRDPEGGFEVVLIPGEVGPTFQTDVLAPAKSYWPNEYGIYNMSGNAAEMIDGEAVVMGGDWRSPGYDVRILSEQRYNGPKPTIGFRIVATVMN